MQSNFQCQPYKPRNSSTNYDAQSSNVGYYLKRKLAKSVYGFLYKGVVIKRRKVLAGEEFILEKQIKHSSKVDFVYANKASCGKTSASALASIVEDFSCQPPQIIAQTANIQTSVEQLNDNSKDIYIWENTGQSVVIKISSWARIQRIRGKHLEDPVKEIQALQLLGGYHKNIISNIEALQDDDNLYCVLPFCTHGDLYGVVQKEISGRGRLCEKAGKYWFSKILKSLHHLQLKGICHRDLALENILVDGREIKLIDFGMALRVPHSDPRRMNDKDWTVDVSEGGIRRLIVGQGQGGKWDYMAPEIVSRESSFDGFAIDLWAAGVILYIMLMGHKPFHWAHSSDASFYQLSVEGRLKQMLTRCNIQLSDDACDLLQNMLWKCPRRRFTLSQVMEHRWMKNETRMDEIDHLPEKATSSIASSIEDNRSQSINENPCRVKLSRIWPRFTKKSKEP